MKTLKRETKEYFHGVKHGFQVGDHVRIKDHKNMTGYFWKGYTGVVLKIDSFGHLCVNDDIFVNSEIDSWRTACVIEFPEDGYIELIESL
jgi:hypothetical protein